MTTMNQSQYAQHSGVDRKTIGRWIKAGRFIVMDGDLIDVEASDAALKTHEPRTRKKRKHLPPVMAAVLKLRKRPSKLFLPKVQP